MDRCSSSFYFSASSASCVSSSFSSSSSSHIPSEACVATDAGSCQRFHGFMDTSLPHRGKNLSALLCSKEPNVASPEETL